jgi:hypothetical protein
MVLSLSTSEFVSAYRSLWFGWKGFSKSSRLTFSPAIDCINEIRHTLDASLEVVVLFSCRCTPPETFICFVTNNLCHRPSQPSLQHDYQCYLNDFSFSPPAKKEGRRREIAVFVSFVEQRMHEIQAGYQIGQKCVKRYLCEGKHCSVGLYNLVGGN